MAAGSADSPMAGAARAMGGTVPAPAPSLDPVPASGGTAPPRSAQAAIAEPRTVGPMAGGAVAGDEEKGRRA